MALSEFIEFVGHSAEGLTGWRYFVSSSFRQRTHERWRMQSRLDTAGEIAVFGISFAFVTLIVAGLVWWLLPG